MAASSQRRFVCAPSAFDSNRRTDVPFPIRLVEYAIYAALAWFPHSVIPLTLYGYRSITLVNDWPPYGSAKALRGRLHEQLNRMKKEGA